MRYSWGLEKSWGQTHNPRYLNSVIVSIFSFCKSVCEKYVSLEPSSQRNTWTLFLKDERPDDFYWATPGPRLQPLTAGNWHCGQAVYKENKQPKFKYWALRDAHLYVWKCRVIYGYVLGDFFVTLSKLQCHKVAAWFEFYRSHLHILHSSRLIFRLWLMHE